jgi:hypothetical protein
MWIVVTQKKQEYRGHNHENGEDAVFRFQEGHCPLSDISGNSAHALIAGILFIYPATAYNHVNNG